jgi:hypothetical protein
MATSSRRHRRRGPSMVHRVDRFMNWIVPKMVGVFGLTIVFVLYLVLVAAFVVIVGERFLF